MRIVGLTFIQKFLYELVIFSLNSGLKKQIIHFTQNCLFGAKLISVLA